MSLSAHEGPRLAARIDRLRSSLVREILSVINRPGMVSFAGGLPAQWSFPELPAVAPPAGLLQYGTSEGEPALRAHIADTLRERGLEVTADQVLILSGSQQGIDLVAKLLVDEHTRVAVELPTYLAALQVFDLYGARYVTYERSGQSNADESHRPDRNGLLHPDTGGLRLDEAADLLYTTPTFQNPTGACYSADERQALADWCDRHNAVLFEDDPYRELAYDEAERRPIAARLSRAEWIYQSSFSKTLCPGLRIGYLACSPRLYPLLVQLKQAADLHTNRVAQGMVLDLVRRQDATARLETLQHDYRVRRDAFDAMLQCYLGDHATWQTPAGGLFFWLQLVDADGRPRALDLRSVLPEALERGVAFMPGEPFFVDGRAASGCLRLNFSHAAPGDAERGLRELSRLLCAVSGS